LENFEVYVGDTMMICFDYIVALIVHKHFVVKEIFLHIPVGSNSGKYFLQYRNRVGNDQVLKKQQSWWVFCEHQ
jgi:hypothetical protein